MLLYEWIMIMQQCRRIYSSYVCTVPAKEVPTEADEVSVEAILAEKVTIEDIPVEGA